MRRGFLQLAAIIVVLAVPAQAAATGPASFHRATGGQYVVPVHSAGVTIYSTSPAYVVLRVNPTTASLEHYASTHSFPWVAIRDTRSGRVGMDCFADGHLLIVPFFINDFKEGALEYHGLFLQYASWYFRPGDLNASHCGLVRSPGPIVATIEPAGSSAKLALDCQVRLCRGTLVTFGARSTCTNPITVIAGKLGCRPLVTGTFQIPGGLRGVLKLPLNGRSLRTTTIAITVGGKRVTLSRMSDLPAVQGKPRAPGRSSLSVSCPSSGGFGTSVTVSGSLSPSSGRVPVTLTVHGADGSTQTIVVLTAGDGSFSARLTPSVAGAWTVDASFAGNRTRLHSSARCGFQVTQHRSAIALTCPSGAGVASAATVSGTLDPALAGQGITLTYQPPMAGAAVSHSASTGSGGTFTDSITPAVNQPGIWSVQANWPGDRNDTAASASCQFTVS